jgi:hypothetical protein
MRISLPFVATLGVCAALASGTAFAQTPEEVACAKTRAEVKADCIQFLKTHRWDEGAGNWVLKTGVRPPEGVKSREEIKAERDKFLAVNRWNDGKTAWEPIPGKARDLSKEPLGCDLTRADVKKDCAQFMKTHRFDEGLGIYVKK